MVKYSDERLNGVFAALADPTRRAILARLALGEATVGELADPFRMSLPAVSKHLGVLESVGLIERQRHGRLRRCRLHGEPLRAAADWIDDTRRFWEGRFDSLARYLEETRAEAKALEGEDDNDQTKAGR